MIRAKPTGSCTGIVAFGKNTTAALTLAMLAVVFIAGSTSAEIEATTPGGEELMRLGPNIALGKACSFSMNPNYPFCRDEGDFVQLTDGKHEPGCSPKGQGTVGWLKRNRPSPVEITIDLEKVEPIAGISYSTFAGGEAIRWPDTILILVSDDGESFYQAGELTTLSYRHEIPPVKGAHVYCTDQLRTHGRYVRLVVRAMWAIVCDEIEIFRGDDSFLKEPRTDEPVTDLKSLVSAGAVERDVRLRLLRDIADVRKRVANSEIDAAGKAGLAEELSALADAALEYRVSDDSKFRAILPLNSLHEEIYALSAAVLRSRGVNALTVWHQCRYDPMHPLDGPSADASKELPGLAIMPGQYQARTLNLTNPTDEIETVRISFAGLLESPTPSWIAPHEVVFTDTKYGRILATVLEPLESAKGSYTVTVQPGMTKQVWLRFHPTTVPPGDYNILIGIQGNSVTDSVTLPIHVSKIRFPERTRCRSSIWDYTDGQGGYSLKNLGYKYKNVVISDLKDHFTNVTWGHRRVIPLPTAGHFNDHNELIKPLDWRKFDQWVQFWDGDSEPDHYLVFLNFKTLQECGGAAMGTPEFGARVRAWGAAWRRHVQGAGLIRPEQVGVLIWDEISTDEQAQAVLDWIRPLKSGYPELLLVQTSTLKQPDQSKVQDLFEFIDIFLPALGYYDMAPDPAAAKAFYADHVARRGAQVWSYLNMHIALADPYGHYRMLPWRAWTRGMQGIGFWSYSDAGGNTWERYGASTRASYSTVFIGKGTLHDTKHWEAYREGLQDYELLALLRDRVAECRKQGQLSAILDEAERLLAELPRSVEDASGSEWAVSLHWWKDKDRTVADRASDRVLALLESLSEE